MGHTKENGGIGHIMIGQEKRGMANFGPTARGYRVVRDKRRNGQQCDSPPPAVTMRERGRGRRLSFGR